MKWSEVSKTLKSAPPEAMFELIRGLYKLSAENKAFVHTQLSPQGYQDQELLEKSRKKVIKAIYPEHVNFPDNPRFGESRKIIRAYQKATNDISGTIDLMLTHVERGTQFTNDFGDMYESFYTALETMLDNTIELLLKSPNTGAIYEEFANRFKAIEFASRRIGWGYSDVVNDMVTDLQEKMGDR